MRKCLMNRPLISTYGLLLLAIIWLTAGLLKAWEVYRSPMPALLGFVSRPLLAGVAGLELLIGMAIALQWWPSGLRWLQVILFGAFTALHLGTVSGLLPACGCLGQMAVPSWVMATGTALLTVVVWVLPQGPSWRPLRVRIFSALATILLLTVGVTALIIRTSSPVTEGLQSVTLALDKIPELSKGNWRVVFYRPGCAACQVEMAQVRGMIKRADSRERWCLVNVDKTNEAPFTMLPALSSSSSFTVLERHLPDQWLATPQMLLIMDGRVVKAVGHVGEF